MLRNPEEGRPQKTDKELEYAEGDLIALRDEAKDRLTAVELHFAECGKKISEEEKRIQHAEQELEALEKQEDKITGEMGWRGYADKLKDYQDDTHATGLSQKLLSQQVELKREMAHIQKEVKDYEKKISDIQWQMDARKNK